MTRKQFVHTIRAAAAVLGVDEILIIGSQAIHGSLSKGFPAANRSIEVDISLLEEDGGRAADLLEGSIGEASMFQENFGYYAQGVEGCAP